MRKKILSMLKEILFGADPIEVPHQPIPPRDKYIEGFNEFNENIWKLRKEYHKE